MKTFKAGSPEITPKGFVWLCKCCCFDMVDQSQSSLTQEVPDLPTNDIDINDSLSVDSQIVSNAIEVARLPKKALSLHTTTPGLFFFQ